MQLQITSGWLLFLLWILDVYRHLSLAIFHLPYWWKWHIIPICRTLWGCTTYWTLIHSGPFIFVSLQTNSIGSIQLTFEHVFDKFLKLNLKKRVGCCKKHRNKFGPWPPEQVVPTRRLNLFETGSANTCDQCPRQLRIKTCLIGR